MRGELEEPFGQTMAWILRANGPDFSRCRLTNRTYDFHAHYFITYFGCSCGPSLCGLQAASKRDLHMLCIEDQITLYCCYANGHYALAPRKTTCAFIDHRPFHDRFSIFERRFITFCTLYTFGCVLVAEPL
jgi:hypothetical protein